MDVCVKPEHYCQRAKELGHTSVFTTNHAVTGNIFDWMEVAKEYELKMYYGFESYYVNDRFEKDKSNKHIILIAKNNMGVYQINEIMSEAHTTGFYYRPRIDKELLFSLNPDNTIVTTACVAGIWDDPELLLALNKHFKNNFFLEVQNHNIDIQKKVNRELLNFSIEAGIPLIHANDSHYILPEDSKYRDIFLRGKGRVYDAYDVEEDMILDYPDSDTIFERYKKQGILNKSQVQEALDNTLIFDDCQEITIINDDVKLPSISENPVQELKDIINSQWKIERKNIPVKERKKYLEAIRKEMEIIEKTNMQDYFIIDYKVAKKGQDDYGGKITKTGRGCFVGNVFVPTFDGGKLLKDVKVGDKVISEDGKFHEVVKTMKYNITEDMIMIKLLYGNIENYPLICTKDHKILVLRNNKREWIQAQFLTDKDCACFPKNIVNAKMYHATYINQDENFYYFPVEHIYLIENYSTVVYDLEVADVHSYLVNNIIVHNSAPSFYTTKTLGLTDIDRISSPITLYPTRFMSIERILNARSLPDIDLNTTDREPFIKATEELLGKENCAWMLAWKPLQDSSAFRIYCKGIGKDILEYDDIAKNIDDYRDNSKWKNIIEESKRFIGVVDSVSESPCSMVLYDKPIKQELGLVRTAKGKICCLLNGYYCDKYKYLKNDYLTVTVWAIIRDVCKLAGIPIPTIKELNELLDDKTYKIYEDGLTCTINQADSDFATELIKRYKPKSVSEMSAFVAIIRPGCASLLQDFIDRKPYTTGVKDLDELLVEGNHRMIYQELIMKYLIWLDIPEAGSYDIIKKIAKKKFKEEELAELKEKLLTSWRKRVGTDEGFIQTWTVVEQAAKYSFNACVSGDTIIQKIDTDNNKKLTVEEMYLIKNSSIYAESTGNLLLHKSYNEHGYGAALSMFNDNKIRENKIIDIRLNGVKDIYRVETKSGAYLDCTMNHKFPTPNGKMKLKKLKIGDFLYIFPKRDNLVAKMVRENGVSTALDEIKSIVYLRTDRTYDIEMEKPAHTYISDSGLVTSNSHSLSYAYDSLYGAYLKSHYPLEYYTVALNYYEDDSRRTAGLTSELATFNICLKPIKFRHSQSNYSLDRENNSIYKGIKSIKEMNINIAGEMYELRNNEYKSFVDLLYDLKEKTTIKINQLIILTELNFFSEFGEINYLLKIIELFQKIHKNIEISKEKINSLQLNEEMLKLFTKKITAKLYKDIDMRGFLVEWSKNVKVNKRTLQEIISSQKEYLGYIDIKDDRYSKMLFIDTINTKYSPKLKVYSLKYGTYIDCKIDKKTYRIKKVENGDILKLLDSDTRPKLKRLEDGNYEPIPNTSEIWLTNYQKINL